MLRADTGCGHPGTLHGPHGRMVVPLKVILRIPIGIRGPVHLDHRSGKLVWEKPYIRTLDIFLALDVRMVSVGDWTDAVTPAIREEANALVLKYCEPRATFHHPQFMDPIDPTSVSPEERRKIFLMTAAISKQDGSYIGGFDEAYKLIHRYGITQFYRSAPDHAVASIGYGEKTFLKGKGPKPRWFGWSHRALYGFEPGDVVSEGDTTASSGYTEEYLKDHPEESKALPVGFKAETMDDARRMAIAFADSVG